jgi:hypothetical protein
MKSWRAVSLRAILPSAVRPTTTSWLFRYDESVDDDECVEPLLLDECEWLALPPDEWPPPLPPFANAGETSSARTPTTQSARRIIENLAVYG